MSSQVSDPQTVQQECHTADPLSVEEVKIEDQVGENKLESKAGASTREMDVDSYPPQGNIRPDRYPQGNSISEKARQGREEPENRRRRRRSHSCDACECCLSEDSDSDCNIGVCDCDD